MKQQRMLSIFFLMVLFALNNCVHAQQVLTLNPAIKSGKLANGLTYYILPNKKPEQKVELRLVVNAGSINEDENQQGLAHFCEHMAFNGTTHFKRNEIISFLQDIGVGFGNDLNAYTSFDKTVYILPIPTDKPDNLEKGFQVIEDWAHNVTYLDDDIDGERNIILEESRLGKGALDRMYRKIYPKLFKNSLYANRIPIGLDSIVKNFKHEDIRRFYKDFYRPDLMAVIVVGDISVEKAEAYIQRHFAGITNPANERERKYATVPAYTNDDAIVVTDKEATRYNTYIQFSNFVKKPITTETDYKNYIIQSLFVGMFDQRLQEITQQSNPPFVSGKVDFESDARGYDAFSLFAGSGTQNPQNALNALITEIERAKRFGFTASELERAKKNYESAVENKYNNRDKIESGELTDELIDHFLDGDAMPGIEKEFSLTKEILPAITINDVNTFTDYIKEDNKKLVAIMGPESTGSFALPDSAAVLNAFANIQKSDIQPYTETKIASELLSQQPKAGKIISKKYDAKTGTTELSLSNGIKVTLKKTDFKSDEIVMAASRLGGTNEYGLAAKYSAVYATQVVNAMGYGNFSPINLKKYLAGKTISVNTNFTITDDQISGGSSVKDFEYMLQLLYLKLTSPRKDTALFNTFIKKQESQFAGISANPTAVFIDTTYKVLYNNNPLAMMPVPHSADFAKINIDSVLKIYQSHFCDMNQMQFAFAGNLNEDIVIPLIEKYIASLPVTNRKFNCRDNKVRYVKGKKRITVYKGQEEKSFLIMVYSGAQPYSEELDMKLQAAKEVLNILINEELREKIQGIYGGEIDGSFVKYPYGNYSYMAYLPCGPQKIDTLETALLAEIKSISTKGTDLNHLNKVKQQWKESHKEAIKTNKAWVDNLLVWKVDGFSIDRFINYEKYVDLITLDDVKYATGLFLNEKNMIVAKLMPAKYKH